MQTAKERSFAIQKKYIIFHPKSQYHLLEDTVRMFQNQLRWDEPPIGELALEKLMTSSDAADIYERKP